MEELNIEPYRQLVTLIEAYLSKNFLKTKRNEKANYVNTVRDTDYVLLSSEDLSKINNLNFSQITTIAEFPKQVLLPKVKNELQIKDVNRKKLNIVYEKLENSVKKYLIEIKRSILPTSSEGITKFLEDYGNGIFHDPAKFTSSFEEMVSEAAIDEELKEKILHEIQKIIDIGIPRVTEVLDLINKKLKLLKNNSRARSYITPKSIAQIDQVDTNKGKVIPYTNGIDFHPNKNIYISMSGNNGDVIIRNQEMNQEISRIKLNNNCGINTQNCLWSPSGETFMVSTRQNHSIYIFDKTGQNMLKSIERAYSKDGHGAIWLSEIEVAIGYEDGLVKFFNIEWGIEIEKIKLNAGYAWGMDCLDDTHLLVGDSSGSISNINWKQSKLEWVKTDWHTKNSLVACLRLNSDKTMLLTSSSDCYVKLMKLVNGLKVWEFKLNDWAIGILWVPSELYVLALSTNNQLVVLNSRDGTKILEFNGLSSSPRSLRLNPETGDILVGDTVGTIRRLKICGQGYINKIVNFIFLLNCFSS